MTAFYLRPARSTDAGRTGAILSAFIDETPWMPRIHTRAEDLSFAGQMIECGWVTVAEDEQGVAGFLARDCETIHALYVHNDARRRGCGAAMIAEAQSKVDALTLWTFQANAAAQAFYSRQGFVEVDRTDGASNDEGLPDIRFEWKREHT